MKPPSATARQFSVYESREAAKFGAPPASRCSVPVRDFVIVQFSVKEETAVVVLRVRGAIELITLGVGRGLPIRRCVYNALTTRLGTDKVEDGAELKRPVPIRDSRNNVDPTIARCSCQNPG